MQRRSASPNISSVDGKFRWDFGRGILKTDTNSLAVAPSGDGGEPGDIQKAVDYVLEQGGGTIYLRNGTYLPDSDIILPSNINLIGESQYATIIDFNSQGYQIKAEGTNAYTTGTAAATNRSATVTGTGTAWTTAMIGQVIWLRGIYYVITNVASATSLTIELPFEELTSTGLSYAIADPKENISIHTLTVQNSTNGNGAILYRYVNGSVIRDVAAYDSTVGLYFNFCNGIRNIGFDVIGNGTGIHVDNAGGFTFNDFFLYLSTGAGMSLNKLIGCEIANFTCSSNTGNGFTFTNCSDMGFFDATLTTNDGHGIEMSGCRDVEIFGVSIKFNLGDGIKLTSDADRTGINLVTCLSNTGYGINVASATDLDNTITSCFFSGNGAGTINNLGTTTITANNQT